MKKILVIDDEIWLREMVRAALSQKGYDVIEAENGAKGVEKARQELPDLVICDVNMDGMDGYLTLANLRKEPVTTAIPFILMTGMADNAGMRHGMELGADDYLPKPFTIENLYAAVETRLKKASVLREEAEKRLSDLRENISLMLPHELRTPLNGILAYGEIFSSESRTLQPAEIAEMGQLIYESGKRLERLIENFLIYAQTELMAAGQMRELASQAKPLESAGLLVENRARQQAEEAGRANDLALELAQAPVCISEDYLGKIVDELVGNAFKFSKPGTPVRVRLSKSPDAVTLMVVDRGRGMSSEHIAKVGAYMQFERKMHEQQGLGLGLIIAKRLTELHDGRMSIQSEPGMGTAIAVKFPTKHAGGA